MASPGMMQSGLSRQLFEAWCTDKRNGVIVAGYCVEGTLAKVGAWHWYENVWIDLPVSMVMWQHVLSEPSEVVTMSGQKLPLRMSVGESHAGPMSPSHWPALRCEKDYCQFCAYVYVGHGWLHCRTGCLLERQMGAKSEVDKVSNDGISLPKAVLLKNSL